MPPLSNPDFVPSLESSGVGIPVIRFSSVFDPDPKPTEEMSVQSTYRLCLGRLPQRRQGLLHLLLLLLLLLDFLKERML